MKYLASVFFLFTCVSASAETKIKTTDAPMHQGENVIACGMLKEVKKFKKGIYLNMDDIYPKQSVTFVLWQEDVHELVKRLGSIASMIGKNVCGKGVVADYKGRSQIILYNAYSLSVD